MTPDTELGAVLVARARGAIAAHCGRRTAQPEHAALAAPGATFVTLRQDGALRGCIGSLEARRPLGVDVHENAIAAAFRDPRFAPLPAVELAVTTIEVSLLSRSEPIAVVDEDDALARLRPNVDGVILEYAGRRATFLPQVWEQLPTPREFLAALKQKAGLPIAFWNPRVRLARYTVAKFAEHAVVAAGVGSTEYLRAARSGSRPWDDPAGSLEYLRAERSGIRPWDGPADSLEYLRAARSGTRPWDDPAGS